MRWVKGAGLYNLMIDYIMKAIHLCFILAIYSAVELVVDSSSLDVPPFMAVCNLAILEHNCRLILLPCHSSSF